MPKSVADVRVQAFIDKINKTYEGSVAEKGGKFTALQMHRFSSGILHVDLCLGGGWPFSRIALVAGNYSSGKTLLAIKACVNVEKHCMNCRAFHDLCKCGDFTPSPALFIDLEGSFDMRWAAAHGFNGDFHVVARPETAEQAVDIIDAAIRENAFGLIVLDSIEAMTPIKEVEESAEDWQMGLGARLVNKAMRRWNASLNKLSQTTKCGGPLLLCINQLREKLGVVMGDPRVLPKGKGQEFASSIMLFTKPPKIEDGPEDKETAYVTLRGVMKKNKTYIPHLEYEISMALKDTEEYKKGEVDNDKQLLKFGKKVGLVKKIGDGVGFDVTVCKSETALLSHFKHKPEIAKKLWRSIILAECGVMV